MNDHNNKNQKNRDVCKKHRVTNEHKAMLKKGLDYENDVELATAIDAKERYNELAYESLEKRNLNNRKHRTKSTKK